MGPEILAIVIISGIISLTSAGVSLGTFFHFKKKHDVDNKSKVGVDIDHTSIDEEVGEVHRHVTHKKLHFDQVNESSVRQTVDLLRTGLPNEVANKLASNMGGISSALSPSSLIGSRQVSELTPKKSVDSHQEKAHHHRKHSESGEKKKPSEVESSASLLDQIILLEEMDKSLSQHDGSVDIIGHEGQ